MGERLCFKDTVGIMRLEGGLALYRSNISGGSTEQSFQNEASARLPIATVSNFQGSRDLSSVSRIENDNHTSDRWIVRGGFSRYAVTESGGDFAKFRLAKAEAGFPCADAGPVQIILTRSSS